MDALAEHYRVAALDLRGYNLSDKPRGSEQYAMRDLVGDVANRQARPDNRAKYR